MEVDENADTESVLQILGLLDMLNNAAGANANVLFIIIRSEYLPLLAAV